MSNFLNFIILESPHDHMLEHNLEHAALKTLENTGY